jgi:hypothetical protein
MIQTKKHRSPPQLYDGKRGLFNGLHALLVPECSLDATWDKDCDQGRTLATAQHTGEATGEEPKGRADGHRDRDQNQRIFEVCG